MDRWSTGWRRACAPGLLITMLLASPVSLAQVYTCIAEDGSRVFSDQRCGPDAKLVPGMGKTKPSQPKQRASARPAKPSRTPVELEQLTQRCNAGDMKACTEWTLSGGPKLLRDAERKAELDCEAGSLAACEERYCRDVVDADCRARVLRTAKLAGEGWYLREESRQRDGRTRYIIRCIPRAPVKARDISVSCASEAAPDRCQVADTQQRYARLAEAAASHCLASSRLGLVDAEQGNGAAPPRDHEDPAPSADEAAR